MVKKYLQSIRFSRIMGARNNLNWSGALLNALALTLTIVILVVEYGFTRPVVARQVLHYGAVLAAFLLWGSKIYDWALRYRQDFTWRKPLLYSFLLLLLVTGEYMLGIIFPTTDAAVLERMRWGLFNIYLLVLVILRLAMFSVAAASFGRAPARALLMSFATIIIIGAGLLMLPSATHSGHISLTDAVFTATSATCVTGLIVKDTGSDFTRLGQVIILVMLQIGGLGIMIFGSLFALLMGSSLSLRESVAMRDIMNEQAPGRISRIIVFICILTFLLETMGTIGLYGMWQTDTLSGGQIFKSIFHSVSAFCNAGFSLQKDNLSSYRYNWQVFGIIASLIVLGGLGFPVLHNLWCMFVHRLKSNWCGGRDNSAGIRLTLHSKIVLSSTVILLLLGTVLLVLLEYARPDISAGKASSVGWLDALFASVSARTAGFNTVDTAHLGDGSKLVLIFLMCIGGSPSGTAGGIKTVTLAIMVLTIYATMRRRQQVQVFKRTIPIMIIRRASTLIILYALLIWVLSLLLTITEYNRGNSMLDLLFEVVSAMGTVGLSTGVTSHLTIAGRWVIIAAMFVGRLGPLSLLTALSFDTRPERYEYPREPLVVG